MSSKKRASNKQQQKQQAKETKKQTSGDFPVKTLLFFTFLALGIVIYSDVELHGSWKNSNTAHLLKRYHVCEYSHKVLNKTSDSIRWVNSEIDKQFPGYEKKIHETLEPYRELLGDVGVITCNMMRNVRQAVVDGWGIVADKIEQQAPGLLEKTGEGFKTALSLTVSYTRKSVTYLKEEVFVGKMAPEHMGKVLIESFSSLQQMVNECYIWAYEKIRTVVT